jgi:dihydrofolate reductase
VQTILLAAVTANGFIARSTNELANWTSKEDKKFFVEETKKAGVMVMGRTTFATIGKALPGRLIIVLTNDPTAVETIPGSVEPMSGTPAEVLAHLEKRGFSSVVIAGGANVYSQFLNAGLVDELALTIESILFTSGVRLAENLTRELLLELMSVEKLGATSVLLRYSAKLST